MAEERAGLPIHPFKSVAAFEKWLERHHETADGLWVKIGKKANPAPSITYDEAVEVGLCFGWIDGLKNTYDELWYVQRFTPRKPRSIWSQTNVVRVERLLAEGRMRPAGLAQVEAAQADGRWDRAYPGSSTAEVPADFQAALAADPAARAAFDALNRQGRYSILFRIHEARRADTRARRIDEFVRQLAAGEPTPNVGPRPRERE